MIKNKYILLVSIIVLSIFLGAAYNIVKAVRFVETSTPAVTPPVSPPDSTPIFKIKKIQVDSYDDLSNSYALDAPKPNNVKSVVEYDTKTNLYVFKTYVGNMEIGTSFSMTPTEYSKYSEKTEMQSYWKEKNSSKTINNEDKFSITDMKFNIGPADKVFGPGGVQVKTQGSAELVFGIKNNNIQNPTLTEKMRNTTIFNFDEKIQMNVTGSVGDKVNFNLNYNTESTFDFDQKMIKLAYKGKEDDIIQNIQAGNVSMPLNSSLITGSTALFGIKTDLKFGKLNVSAIASQQESETKTVSSKGGVQKTKFEIKADEYDENRHFFLSHYFRDNYESSVSKLPVVTSGVTINRIEVWITNKKASYDQSRNVVAFMDLGEAKHIGNSHWLSTASGNLSQNSANTLYNEVTNIANVRDIEQTNDVLQSQLSGYDIDGGQDYEKIESARKLESSEYTLNSSLGFISLKSALNSDEVLAVAYEYTYGGKVYQVGEFSTDITTSTDALVVKLLRGTSSSPELPIWDLMMKNVYSLGAMQLQKDGFKLNIVYNNDSLGTDLQYISEGNISNQILLRVMNLDRLDSKNNTNPDGVFDYVEGYTVLSSTGRVFFPVLEPFGSYLAKKIDPSYIASNPSALVEKYVFTELYDSTLVVAQELSEKNKFLLTGEYKASSGSQISLNAMNVPRGSVTVTAGGTTLTENVDYTVDYTMGTVTILNQSIIESGTSVDVKLENQSNYNMQRKTLVGTHMEYEFSKNFLLGGTIMHLSELPLTTKVNTGDEPISNTIWGLNTSWQTESQWLTNVIDKLPFVNATKPSTIALNAEYAQLIPGHSSIVSNTGLAYIDDFESTQTSIDIHYPINWHLASTPYDPNGGLFPEAALSNDVAYGKSRALLSWYYVDPSLNLSNSTTPSNLKNDTESKSNHLTRNVYLKEVFPNKETLATTNSRMTILNLTYYPTERGPYNLDVDGMDENGKLTNPEDRWGGIMRKLDVTDFETANIQYIEFWMMDPFIYNTDGSDKGGDLYFNLGDISEDILKDGKKSFENGLPITDDDTNTKETVWGRVSKTQSTVTAFDNTSGARKYQDVGLDGIADDRELTFSTYQDYVDKIKQKVNSVTLQTMTNDPFSPINDPSGDDYHHYRGTDYDNEEASILLRYKRYNGTEGNSPDASDVTESYSTSATSLPDNEDVNADNTMNEYEKYYQYKVEVKPDKMVVGSNYITDKITSNVTLENGNTEAVTWYQFKIPVREYNDKIGTIRNFKSIRFIRMFLTNFSQETTLRLATLDLVRGDWRTYTKNLYSIDNPPVSDAELDVQAVNIEENANKTPVNYILPPGVTRQTDPSQSQLLQLNEQSMVLKVNNLSPGDARAVYKNTSYDMRQYKKIQMFIHAEKLVDDQSALKDYDLSCFIRIGSDMVNNYYEYEIPLKLTPAGLYDNDVLTDRETVWYPENMLNIAFSKLTKAKLKRNKARGSSSSVSNLTAYTIYDDDNPLNKITIVGNPSISDVENVMVGVRNNGTTIKDGEIWINELRMAGYDESGGWAAMGNLALGLSDIGTVNLSGRVETSGYGSLESNVTTRRLDDLYQMNMSTSMELGRFFPEKAKLQIPAYFSYSTETSTPKYNPLDEDILLSDALENLSTQAEKDSLKSVSQTINTTKSFNITSAKANIKSKKPQFYDPANVSFTYAYTETTDHDPEIEQDMSKQQRGAINYNYSFSNAAWEPFKKIEALDKPLFKIIKEFNLNLLPSQISFNTDMYRNFSKVKLREYTTSSTTTDDATSNLTFSKDFMWNRNFDIKFDLSKSLHISFQTAMNSNIEESFYTPEIGKEYYEKWRDTVWSSIKKLGTPYTYQQVFSASWALPINKIPLLDWVTMNAAYNSTYSWNRTATVDDENIGNIASSMGAWQADGQLNFELLYNKSKYLKDVNRLYSSQSINKKFTSKTYKQIVKLQKDKRIQITHRLGSDRIRFDAVDVKGRKIDLKFKTLGSAAIELQPDVDLDSVSVIVTTIDPNYQTSAEKVVSFAARMLMSLRRASFTYRESNSMVLPGLLPEPNILGQHDFKNGLYSPGFGFAFGVVDNDIIEKFKNNGWLYTDTLVVNPANTAFTSDLDIKASLEPITGLKIELNAKRYEAKNSVIQYMYDGMPTTYTGSYNITAVALATAFQSSGNATNSYANKAFTNFLAYRSVIQSRLNSKLVGSTYPTSGFFTELSQYAGQTYDSSNGSYDINSADVLIPAFLAAYTGKEPKDINTNPFLGILSVLPNWRLSYDGLSKIEFFKNLFKSISLTHAYTCRYSIGSYTSYSSWVASGLDENIGYVRDINDNPVPSSAYDISTVTLSEQFSPLIGINAALKNSMTAKVELRKQRNLALNISSIQLVDANTDEYVVGFGYVIKDFDVILRLKSDKQSKIKNDLKFSADVSYKDIKSLLRNVDTEITQASSGNKLLTIKIAADYVFSSKVNIQLFYDRQASTPLISSSYPVSTTNYGVSFKFMLTR
jgi:cell surface protein SprA